MKQNNKLSLSLLAIVIAIPLTILALPQRTHIEQNASQIQNLNTAINIKDTKNPDGSMGPITSDDNFSSSLNPSQKGDLTIFVMDKISKGESAASNANTVAGPQPVKSLQVTVNKLEVHLVGADVFKDSEREHDDYWETINLGNPKVIDIAQLSRTNTLDSFGITTLAAGQYAEVRMYITHAIATLEDDTVVRVDIQDHDGIIAVSHPFTILPSRTTNITLNIDAQHSVIKINGIYYFKPVVANFLENK